MVQPSQALLPRYGKHNLAQHQDNVTEWEIVSWCQQPGLPIMVHYKFAMNVQSQVGTRADMAVDVARMSTLLVPLKFKKRFNSQKAGQLPDSAYLSSQHRFVISL